jgi:hypothetical protein
VSAGPIAFAAVAALLVATVPRRWAVLPILLASAYTTRVSVVELGPANLSALRVVVVVGLLRMAVRGERLANGINSVDGMLAAWAVLLVGFSAFHTSDAWTLRLGMVLGELGVYVLCRAFVQDADDVRWLFKATSAALAPLAILMLVEKLTEHNLFLLMGGPGLVNIREGHVRAYGPFAHSILAGTVGATCLPMALALWRRHRGYACIGLFSAAGIVFASTSSGPIMMVLFTGVGLVLWNVRTSLAAIRWAALAAIVALQMVMKDPVYFLMARIDITGGSTGWHRAQLVRSSLEHLDEWWLAGTDYTRHWMPTGVHANEIHTDITNHFLAMGVLGGLPLLAVFVFVLVTGFRAVGRAMAAAGDGGAERVYLVWTLGAMLFAQAVNFWSISLFDQSVSFFYVVLAAIGAVHAPAVLAAARAPLPVNRVGPRAALAGARVAPAPPAAVTLHSGWSRARLDPRR